MFFSTRVAILIQLALSYKENLTLAPLGQSKKCLTER
jgi:hypothetical protein